MLIRNCYCVARLEGNVLQVEAEWFSWKKKLHSQQSSTSMGPRAKQEEQTAEKQVAFVHPAGNARGALQSQAGGIFTRRASVATGPGAFTLEYSFGGPGAWSTPSESPRHLSD